LRAWTEIAVEVMSQSMAESSNNQMTDH